MATVYWLGGTTAVAQVDTVTITADNNDGTTYTITIGDQTISTADTGNTTTTATNLTTAFNASTHPYFKYITASSAAAVVTLTADEAGVPFVAASSVAGGTGTIGAVASSVACSGPNHWDTADNWSGGAVPVNDDDVIVADSAVNICWGLAQSAVTLTTLEIRRSYTGRLGLDTKTFAKSADAETTMETASPQHEYRAAYLNIKVSADIEIGQHTGIGSVGGSGRIMLDTDNTACDIIVHSTANTTADAGRPAVRLLTNNVGTNLIVRKALAGVGVAADVPNETSTIGTIRTNCESLSSIIVAGEGVTINTAWYHDGGTGRLQAAATVAALSVYGGEMYTEGDYTITAVGVYGGDYYCNHIKTGGNAITTLNGFAGTIDGTGSRETRTWATCNFHSDRGGLTVVLNDSIAITTPVFTMAGGNRTITFGT